MCIRSSFRGKSAHGWAFWAEGCDDCGACGIWVGAAIRYDRKTNSRMAELILPIAERGHLSIVGRSNQGRLHNPRPTAPVLAHRDRGRPGEEWAANRRPVSIVVHRAGRLPVSEPDASPAPARGCFHGRHPRQEYRRVSFGILAAPIGGRLKGATRAICGKTRASCRAGLARCVHITQARAGSPAKGPHS